MKHPVYLLDSRLVGSLIDLALLEDSPFGDVTIPAIEEPDAKAECRIIAKQKCIVAGLPVADMVFRKVDPATLMRCSLHDGDRAVPGDTVAIVQGSAASILKAERIALNFLQRLSGIATITRNYADALEGTGVVLLPTRKTTPGHRVVERYAVCVGGGGLHRASLSDGVLIKDNHIAAAGSIETAVRNARIYRSWTSKIEVETTTLEQVREAVKAGADIIMFDNMPVSMVEEACKICPDTVLKEASGGITLDTVRGYALAGVDAVSVGELTHSPRAVDMSLEFPGAEERSVSG